MLERYLDLVLFVAQFHYLREILRHHSELLHHQLLLIPVFRELCFQLIMQFLDVLKVLRERLPDLCAEPSIVLFVVCVHTFSEPIELLSQFVHFISHLPCYRTHIHDLVVKIGLQVVHTYHVCTPAIGRAAIHHEALPSQKFIG